MSIKWNRLINGLTAFSLTCISGGSVQADDTEIFFNAADQTVQPNILFILDNSSSMTEEVTTTVEYDPDTNYTGDFSSSYIYTDTYYNFLGDLKYKTRIEVAKTSCKDMLDKLSATGVYLSARVAGWTDNSGTNNDQWTSLEENLFSSVTDSRKIECQEDAGIHGETDASTSLYAANKGFGPWTSNSNKKISNWTNFTAHTFYAGNYLNYHKNYRTSTTKTRMQIVKEVTNSLVESLSGVNIGLMTFNPDVSWEGGRVLTPVTNINTIKNSFKQSVTDLVADGTTPLSETLFGAYRYFNGEAPFLDQNPVVGTIDADGNYISPITNECQANNIILLTDGAPTWDADPTATNSWGEQAYTPDEDGPNRTVIENKVGSCTGNCLDEISKYMYDTGMDAITGSPKVRTYTVGFDTDQTLLRNTAEGSGTNDSGGGGTYYTANNTETLKTAFNEIVSKVLSVNTTFVSPGVAVNSFNRLNHRDALFFSVFKPELSPMWDGNLKRYRLGKDGTIRDYLGNIAVSESTGFFQPTAKSWWSSSADGPNVNQGGASHELPDTNSSRKVYTYYSGSASRILSNTANAVNVDNKANLTKTMFGNAAMSDADHEKLINWTRGADVFDEDKDSSTIDTRPFFADPLHSVPHLVTYGGTDASPDITVFFGDNQGFLHAIDGATGAEKFAFIPDTLLANQATLMANEASTTHTYGLDGSVASWTHDSNSDLQIDTSVTGAADDHAYVYVGMRRGGRNYYALNVTDRDNPSLLWSIQGGAGSFTELGQSWSKPVKSKVKVQNSEIDVIIFSGGYDTQQDTVTTRTADTVGRAIYMVNATTGALVWWAGPTGSGADLELASLQYSIPATPKVIDVTGDGLLDQIYVGDMGGQIWRFDIYNGQQARNLATAGVIASLADNTTAGNRRFYHSPDIYGLAWGTSRKLGLTIGSGYQAHPLVKTTEDRIYSIRIDDVTTPPDSDNDEVTDYTTITESDLFDTTDNLIGEGTTSQKETATTALLAKQGWYIRLTRSGEKVLSGSQTIGGQMYITTYEPVPNTTACTPTAGTPRLYSMNVKDGTPVHNWDNVGSVDALTSSDRSKVLDTAGLPPNPQRMRIDGQDIICVGAECDTVEGADTVTKTYWYED